MKKKTKKESVTSPVDDPVANTDIYAPASEAKNDVFEDEELPGYPHYPPTDDIMNPGNNMEKMELSEEKFSRSNTSTPAQKTTMKKNENKPPVNDSEEEEEIMEENDEATVTREDLLLLGSDELSPDEGDDELLRKRSAAVDMSGDDLDVPGSELDDEEELIGEEDEENNSYSIGGDRHDDLEENGTDDSEERI